MKLTYKIMGACGAIAYLVLFTAGIVIDSGPFRAQLTGTSFNIQAFLIVICTYTPINVAILALLAGLIGGCASIITNEGRDENGGDPPEAKESRDPKSKRYLTESPVASMLRAIIVYFGFTAGILVTSVDPFTASSPEKYIRLAAAVSFFSFVVGYDPTKISNFINTPIGGRSAKDAKKD